MGDGNSDMMNLDLNLGPTSPPDIDPLMSESVNLEDWIDSQRPTLVRESARSRMRQRWRSLLGPVPVPFEARSIASEFIVNTVSRGGDFIQTGEGSASLSDEVVKECKNEATLIENEKLGKKNEEEEKESGDEGSFFECNICLDVSSDPVLTCCGHLFCWPCLYQWLNVHSDSKECPVCKGEVTTKNLTPIYGRGSNINNNENEGKTTVKIPDRPQARRVESWRQTIQRNAFTIPMDEMIRRLGSGSDFSRDFVEIQNQNIENLNESSERNSSLLNRILTSRGMRQEQTTTTAPPEDINLTENTNTHVGPEADSSRLPSHIRRLHTYRSVPTVELVNITQRLMESYMRYTTAERNSQEQALPVDDRDSVSSIAAVIHSESQTLDTAVEIDSTVSLSTSSSRRRIDASRVSDVDSGDSRAPRRRRLN